MVIDAHCHVGIDREMRSPPEKLLKVMDENGIDKAIICPVGRYIAVANKEGNDLTLQAVREHPKRFMGLATANPWYGQEAVDELKRGIGEGLIGIKLHPRLQGFLLNDTLVYPICELAESLEVPIYFHTGTAVCATPFQLAELALHFPSVKFIMGHWGHSDFWYDALPVARHRDNVYLESSHMMITVIEPLVQELGVDKVIFGSDYPSSNVRLELQKVKLLGLEKEAEAKVFSKNVLELFGVDEG